MRKERQGDYLGELILCRQQIAAMPYYIETISLNVYSLEELSYYVEHNLYLIGPDFMDEELCEWVEVELKLKETADQLREIREAQGTLSEFVLCLLQASDYCDRQTLSHIRQVLQEMEHKTDFECGKIRADRYMENKKYICAIEEYRKVLRMEEEDTVLVGNVWHNLGTAYSRLFFFEKAASCYYNAYEKNQDQRSLEACLMTYRCMKDERGFKRKAAAAFLSEEETAGIASQLTAYSQMGEIREFEEEIDEAAKTPEEFCKKAQGLLEKWKVEYRKNCKG